MKLSLWTGAAFGFLVAALGVGCAQERDPVNRVQPNALDKRFFVGDDLASPADDPEFYTSTTVVDVPYGAEGPSLFTGFPGAEGLRRVKWEITEHKLLGRLTYENIDGIDGKGKRTVNNGQVVLAFHIESHFDIKRDYNAQTGEESNVVLENTTDRPWYERQFMRVDWSMNEVVSAYMLDPLAYMAIEGMEVDPLQYYVSSPNDPDAPVFSPGEGYFDVTGKVYVKPSTITMRGQTVPSCFYYGAVVKGGSYPWGVCNPAEAKIRYSFLKIAQPGEPGDRDYEPQEWDGARMGAFQAFVQERLGFDEHYGIIDTKWHRYIQRYNIWARSHADGSCNTQKSRDDFDKWKKDTLLKIDKSLETATGWKAVQLQADRDAVDAMKDYKANRDVTLRSQGMEANGTADECEAAGSGARCDTIRQRCTLPYAKRDVRPNAWHYNLMNEDDVIFDATQRATDEWDTALRIAARAARMVECKASGGKSLAGTQWDKTVNDGLAAAIDGRVAELMKDVPPGDGTPDGDYAYETAKAEAKVTATREKAAEACAKAFDWDHRDDVEVEAVRAVGRCWKQKGWGSAACAPAAGSVAAMRPMIALCHSPVRAGEDPACGPAGTVSRVGDLRYHMVNVVPTPQTGSPWGYGPSNADPLTGEVIQASINVWNYVTSTAAQTFIDTMRWMNGEIPISKVTNGDYVKDWAQAAGAHAPGAAPQFTNEEINKRVVASAGPAGDAVKAGIDNLPLIRQKVSMKAVREFARDVHKLRAPIGMGDDVASKAEARAKSLKGTPVEAELVGPEWAHMAGLNPFEQVAGNDALDKASPLRGMDATATSDFMNAWQVKLAQHGHCLLTAPEPTGIVSLAKLVRTKFPAVNGNYNDPKRLQQMWNYLRGRMHYAVIAHEMGHTVGLRHNFTSSFDKVNYRPQYWLLRTGAWMEGSGEDATMSSDYPICDKPQTDGSACAGPRYFDPLDKNELDQSIWTWSHTTTMDYAGDLTQDMLGIGVTDYAAARMFYADAVDVLNDPNLLDSTKKGQALLDMVDYVGGLFPVTVSEENRNLHYTEWNKHFGLIRNCKDVDTSAPKWWNAEKDGIYDPVFDGLIVMGKQCERMPYETVGWENLQFEASSNQLGASDPRYSALNRIRDPQGRVRYPYGYESDEWADGWSPSTYRHDNGADMYEEMVFHDNLYEDRHIFDNFRRGRVSFSIVAAFQRALDRYHAKVHYLAQGFSLVHDYLLHEFAKNNKYGYGEVIAALEGPNGMLRDNSIAAALAFDHYVRVIARPQPGGHVSLGTDPVLRSKDRFYVGNAASIMDLPQGSWFADDGGVSFGARPVQNNNLFTQGYWSFNYTNQAGSYYEKTYALRDLLQGAGRWSLFGRQNGIDASWLNTSFANLYPDGTRRLLGALLTEDEELYAPRVATGTNKKPLIVCDDIADPEQKKTCQAKYEKFKYPAKPLGWVTFTAPDGPQVCWSTNGAIVCTDGKGNTLPQTVPAQSRAIEPQVGWELQKFVVFWAYTYLPATWRLDWVDQMRIYKLGSDVDPSYLPKNYVEWRDPQTGLRYLARKFGDETLMGRKYDKGVGAKMIQWANKLAEMAYEVDPDAKEPFDPETGRFNYLVGANGQPKVKFDSTMVPNDKNNILCEENKACMQLRNYRRVLDFSRDTAARFGYPEPSLNGIYEPDSPDKNKK